MTSAVNIFMEKILSNPETKKNSLESDFFLEVQEAELKKDKIFKEQLADEDSQKLNTEEQ